MTVNNRTSSRDYAKPNVANLLSEDVVRLSEALDSIDTDVAALQSKAPLASPALTGTPSAPTAAIDTNTTQVATTAFVLGQASDANPVINGTAAVGSSLRFARADHIHPTDTTRAPVASPTFTGAPAAPTPAADTNSTRLATTAFVIGQDYTKQTRTIFAGAGLSGGGDLSANRTISADVATQAEAEAGSSSAKLMTPQRTAQAIVANGPLAGFRNAIINGNFDIWQRGTSFTGSEYGADRWIHTRNGTTHTASRQAFTLGQTDVPSEPIYFCRTVVSSVANAGNFALLQQRIEDVRSFTGQQITVSFWAKADASKSIAVELAQSFGSGGSPSSTVTGIGVSKTMLGTSWQKITLTTAIPSVSGKTLGSYSNSHLQLAIFFDAGSDYNARTDSLGQQSGTFDIAQVQLEPGPVATAFEKRPIGTELALCQRYFNKSYAAETNPGTATTSGQLAGSFAAAGTGSMHSIVRYPVVMRSTATVTVYNPVTGASNSARRGGGNVAPTQGSGADSGVVVIIVAGTNVDNYAHHYTASAEL
jgi:hypothetical protein